ncbi:MAG: helix-turn-helix transcriptional regulator [Clostridia bacterium]|nr:helix-turn-helix transcriptional regulator [Clostridia bacterium]
MKNQNICKIPLASLSNELTISCFVLETKLEIMRKKMTLKHNRMVLIEQGAGAFLIDGVSYSFSEGSLIFAFEGESFLLNEGDNVQYIYIDFNGVRSENLFRRFGVYPATRAFVGVNNLIPFCKNCLLNASQESIDIVAESTLLYVFSRLTNNVSAQNDVIQKIVEYTEEHFNDAELSIMQISKELGFNSKYVSHLFKTKMKVNYREYLRSLRIKYAIFLFEQGISSVKNVAYLSGFSDPLYFSSIFKKETGLSPKEFISNLESK